MTTRLEITGLAHGGDALGRIDGKVVFVPDALPGEVVDVEITTDRTDFAKAELRSVVEESPDRISPPCPHFSRCGGCQWQYMEREVQAEAKRETLIGQLEHLGGLSAPPVEAIELPGPALGYRNRMDFTVSQSLPGLRARRSREVVSIDACLLLTPALAELYGRLGDLGQARSVTLRHGMSSDQLLVVLTGAVPDSAASWGVPVVRPTGDSVVDRRRSIRETVADVDFRITAGSFFQNNTAGAERLVALVDDMLGLDRSDRLLDGYGGVGLFACTVGQSAGSVLVVESAEASVPDLEHNLEDAAVPAPEILVMPFEDVEDESWTAAVVDPPRTGLHRLGVEAVVGPRPDRIAYVSCDPASLARDARYLAELGYRMDRAVPVDMFPQTFHLETVALFVAEVPSVERIPTP